VSTLPLAIHERAARIRLLVLDVDGVLTDGSLWYGPDGEALKRFHVRDGMGIRMLRHFGIPTAVISARPSLLVQKRMQDLRIDHWQVGKDDKCAVLAALLDKLSLRHEQVAYLGDDVLDVPVMRLVGLPVAVADAHPFTRQHAQWVTTSVGGAGAVRELADAIMLATNGVDAYESFLTSVATQQPGARQ
jgi:3-deoxy-D-manno-octulosonate 8-phosphate phosphatase (KDO 8-P phosphatase)